MKSVEVNGKSGYLVVNDIDDGNDAEDVVHGNDVEDDVHGNDGEDVVHGNDGPIPRVASLALKQQLL